MANSKLDRCLLEFLQGEAQIRDAYSELDNELISKYAPAFKIGRIEFVEYANVGDEATGKAQGKYTYYNSPDGAGKDCESLSGIKIMGGSFNFRTYSAPGVIWSDEEREYVRLFMYILSAAKGRIRTNERLEHVMYHDMQTGFYNLNYGMRIIRRIEKLGRLSEYASFYLNVKGMSDVNASIGRRNGDKALRMYGKELENVIGPDEVFWRFGGDNFGAFILKKHVDDFLNIIKGRDIRYGIGPRDVVHMSAVAGVYMIDEKIDSHFDVVDGASVAFPIAKFRDRMPYVYFDTRTMEIVERNRHIEVYFETAIKNEEFVVYYQPKVSLDDGKLIGAEALCRWQHGGELVPPVNFIPVLESSFRVCDLDFYMLEHMCRDIRMWIDKGMNVVPVSFNLSRKHLANPRLVKDIVSVIDFHEIPHNLITTEFTETVKENDMVRLENVVKGLKANGINTSVDDFGSGYSSITLIQKVSFDELKIDRDILHLTGEGHKRRLILLRHIVSLANELGMDCIAEGVDSAEKIKLLKSLGCTRAQGFFFDEPLPKKVFDGRLLKMNYDMTI